MVVWVEDWVVMQPVQTRTPNAIIIHFIHEYLLMVLNSCHFRAKRIVIISNFET